MANPLGRSKEEQGRFTLTPEERRLRRDTDAAREELEDLPSPPPRGVGDVRTPNSRYDPLGWDPKAVSQFANGGAVDPETGRQQPSEPFPTDAGVYKNDNSGDFGSQRASRKLQSLSGEIRRRQMLDEISRKSRDASDSYRGGARVNTYAKGGAVGPFAVGGPQLPRSGTPGGKKPPKKGVY